MTIRERILRQIKAEIEAVSQIGDVRRWDARGTINAGSTDAVINVVSEEVAEYCCGNQPPLECTLRVSAGVLLLIDESGANESDTIANRFQGYLVAAIGSNPYCHEDTTNVRLAEIMRVVGKDAPQLIDGGVSASINVEVIYIHDWNNPGSYGTAIVEVPDS